VKRETNGGFVGRVTLLTDFGVGDGYVAAMKGVIAAIAPAVIIDDAGHGIPAGDVHAAAWALGAYWRRYPRGSIHVVVVDPGVGSARRALAVECGGRMLVGPDNGVFSHALAEAESWRAISIENRQYAADTIAPTFHGRDIFAPAAAHLARGIPLDDLGPAVTDPVRFALPQPHVSGGRASGAVIHVDRFGNLVSNIPAAFAGVRAAIAGQEVRLVRSYADAAPGELVAVIGSRGLLEIAVRDASAAERLGVGAGERVECGW
jgi:S-adenosylmethionine hydrolase